MDRKLVRLLPNLIVLIMIGLSVSCSKHSDKSDQTAIDTTSEVATDSGAPKKKGRDSLVVSYIVDDTLSIFELLKKNHQVSYKTSSMGVFVYEIDSIANDDQTFWIYKVNDTMVPKASDAFYPRLGDTVDWHFRIMPR